MSPPDLHSLFRFRSERAGRLGRPLSTMDAASFCEAEYPRLVGSLSLYCGRADLAEDLAQEALERACMRWEQVEAMDHPGAWVHRVAINLTNSRFRRFAAERRAYCRHGPSRDSYPATDVAAAQEVRQAVADLPPRTRAAVVLRYFADMSVGEAAEAMGCAEGTVRSLTHKGLATLRAHLDFDEEQSHA